VRRVDRREYGGVPVEPDADVGELLGDQNRTCRVRLRPRLLQLRRLVADDAAAVDADEVVGEQLRDALQVVAKEGVRPRVLGRDDGVGGRRCGNGSTADEERHPGGEERETDARAHGGSRREIRAALDDVA
jgi:hypothetical protein